MAAMRADFVRAGQKIQTGDLVPGRILCGLVERVNYKALK
jgi:hypothetical protein